MSPDSDHSRDMSDLLGVQVGFSDKMVLHIAEKKAVVAIFVDVVAQPLREVELSFAERSLLVTNFSRAYLLNESVSLSI